MSEDKQAAKFQIEYYFGQTNYHDDDYLKTLESAEGWVELHAINDFPRVRKFGLPVFELYDILKHSTIVEVMERKQKWFVDDVLTEKMIYYVRRKKLQINRRMGQLFGFDLEKVKHLTKA